MTLCALMMKNGPNLGTDDEKKVSLLSKLLTSNCIPPNVAIMTEVS